MNALCNMKYRSQDFIADKNIPELIKTLPKGQKPTNIETISIQTDESKFDTPTNAQKSPPNAPKSPDDKLKEFGKLTNDLLRHYVNNLQLESSKAQQTLDNLRQANITYNTQLEDNQSQFKSFFEDASTSLRKMKDNMVQKFDNLIQTCKDDAIAQFEKDIDDVFHNKRREHQQYPNEQQKQHSAILDMLRQMILQITIHMICITIPLNCQRFL